MHVAEHHSEFRIRRQALPGCDVTVAPEAEGGCDNSIVIGRVPGTKGIAFVSVSFARERWYKQARACARTHTHMAVTTEAMPLH